MGNKKETVRADERLRHIAFIMDGNGRWATKRMLPRAVGHKSGAENFRRIVNYCGDIGIKVVTVYAFSTENWGRPRDEVESLMRLLSDYLDTCVREMEIHKVRYKFIGDTSVFSPEIKAKMQNVEKLSAGYELLLNVGLNYGSRAEITHAFNVLAQKGMKNITEDDISSALYTAGCPDPDLIVRTGGDIRLSNFLLWQAEYSELYFTDILWPDLTFSDVDNIVLEFYKRKRRYGKV